MYTKRYIKSLTGIALMLCQLVLMTNPAVAQVDNIGELIKAGQADAEVLTKEYFRPLSNGLGAGINSGWVNSARPHSRFGFDIQVRAGLSFVPSSGETFDLADLNLQNMRPADAGETVTPTLSGADRPGPEVVVEDEGEEVARFAMPQGVGLSYVPAPEVQVSAGLIRDTDVMLRFVPRVSLDDYGDYGQYGVGLKHRINGTLPGTLPVDLSLMAGYNRVNITADLEVSPEEGALPDPTYTGDYDNQEADISFDTFTVKALVGKTMPFLTVYGGIGYEFSTMSVDVNGDYPVPLQGPFGVSRTETVTDPFSYSQEGDNTISGLVGFKVKLGLLDVFADYTLANYSVLNAGIGVSFR